MLISGTKKIKQRTWASNSELNPFLGLSQFLINLIESAWSAYLLYLWEKKKKKKVFAVMDLIVWWLSDVPEAHVVSDTLCVPLSACFVALAFGALLWVRDSVWSCRGNEMESLLLLSERVHGLSPLFHPKKWCPPAIAMLIEMAMEF